MSELAVAVLLAFVLVRGWELVAEWLGGAVS